MAKDPKTTTPDPTHGGLYNCTDAEAAAFDLDPHLLNLMWDEPFYAAVLRGITKVRSEELPTAGVSVKDGDVRFYWNPKFLATLAKESAGKVRGLNIHECLHLVYQHCTTRRQEPHLVWNYATDCAINSQIKREFLPDCGLIPGEGFGKLTPAQTATMSPEAIARHAKMSDFVKNLPVGLSSEEYFRRFMEDPEISKMLTEPQEGEGGEGGMPGMDSHEGWGGDPTDGDGDGEESAESKAMAKAKLKDIIKRAVDDCDSKGQWGSVSSEMRGEIRAMLTSEVPWQEVLKHFVGNSRRGNRMTSWTRINKRMPGLASGAKRGYTSALATYIDQSGSVGEAELALAFGELEAFTKFTSFTNFHFDTEVDEKSKTEWKRGAVKAPHRTRCGGTDFSAPSKHLVKNRAEFDGGIIITDGYASDPGPCVARRCWLITPGGELQFKPQANDVVIKMKWPKGHAAA